MTFIFSEPAGKSYSIDIETLDDLCELYHRYGRENLVIDFDNQLIYLENT